MPHPIYSLASTIKCSVDVRVRWRKKYLKKCAHFFFISGITFMYIIGIWSTTVFHFTRCLDVSFVASCVTWNVRHPTCVYCRFSMAFSLSIHLPRSFCNIWPFAQCIYDTIKTILMNHRNVFGWIGWYFPLPHSQRCIHFSISKRYAIFVHPNINQFVCAECVYVNVSQRNIPTQIKKHCNHHPIRANHYVDEAYAIRMTPEHHSSAINFSVILSANQYAAINSSNSQNQWICL